MRAERDQHAESQGGKGSNHVSGGFAEAVDDPCEGATTGVPKARDDDAEDRHPACAIARQATARDTRDQETDRSQHGGNRAHKAYSVKAACQSIQLPLPMLGTATTCLFPRTPARGDAVLALASFAMVARVMMRGLA